MNSLTKNVPILTFHKVDTAFEWGVTTVTPNRFENIMAFLHAEGYEAIHVHKLNIGNTILPEKPIIITFDDSYESIYTRALPIMLKYGFTGSVFVITGHVGSLNTWDVNTGGITFNHLNWSHLKKLQVQGFEIGSHTVNHPDLTRIPHEYLKYELVASKKTIEDRIGERVNVVSFPFGRYNTRVVDCAIIAGYCRALGFWKRMKDRNDQDHYVLERKAVYSLDSIFNLKAKLGNGTLGKIENAKLRVINFCSYGTAIVKPMRYNQHSY